jgi:hypothetical protein
VKRGCSAFTLSRSSHELQFRDPRGRLLEQYPAPPAATGWWTAHPEWTRADQIDEETNLPPWDGSFVDYDATVGALLG